jgi:hypothetical protein
VNRGTGENIALADGIADPGPYGRGQVGRQRVELAVSLDQQMQRSQLAQHPFGPADAREFCRDRSQHAGDAWRLGINHARCHVINMGVTGPLKPGEATADLVD